MSILKFFNVMMGQTISYNDKARSSARRGLMEEARDSQRLFFISKELQLNTKFHYMEDTSTSEDYTIFLYISKITVSESRSSHRPTPCQGKSHKKGKKKERKRECEREREKEREEERVRKRKGKRKRGRETKRSRKRRRKRKKRRKRKEKTEKAVLKSFSLKHTAPSEYVP